jgi:hypothetical protein
MPVPFGFVVKNASKTRSAISGALPGRCRELWLTGCFRAFVRAATSPRSRSVIDSTTDVIIAGDASLDTMHSS